ncbi:hypothetical protein LBWT_X2580 (plasmid) [Leptolyngbya boryana IAM M-101]|nr:hypothetical protein LBWT_X2580 [Leptolyngbya boryana IAM M-101]BAS66534.1 hypothetical protein LBDG_X2580 [Leptolyngbya boryana dg5]
MPSSRIAKSASSRVPQYPLCPILPPKGEEKDNANHEIIKYCNVNP